MAKEGSSPKVRVYTTTYDHLLSIAGTSLEPGLYKHQRAHHWRGDKWYLYRNRLDYQE